MRLLGPMRDETTGPKLRGSSVAVELRLDRLTRTADLEPHDRVGTRSPEGCDSHQGGGKPYPHAPGLHGRGGARPATEEKRRDGFLEQNSVSE